MKQNDCAVRPDSETEKKRLQQLTLVELRQELENQTKDALIQQILAVDGFVTTNLNLYLPELLAAVLGFTRSFGRFERNPRNNNDLIASKLEEHVLTAVLAAIPDFISQFFEKELVYSEFKAALRKEISGRFQREIRTQLNAWVEAEASRCAREILAQIKFEVAE